MKKLTKPLFILPLFMVSILGFSIKGFAENPSWDRLNDLKSEPPTLTCEQSIDRLRSEFQKIYDITLDEKNREIEILECMVLCERRNRIYSKLSNCVSLCEEKY